MKERVSSIVQSIKDLWNRTSKKMRIMVLSVTAAILAVSLVVVILLNRTDYIVLYDNLTTAQNAEVIAQLQEMGVQGRLEGTRLLIPKDSENTVRMQLAFKGYQDSGFDYATFEKGSGLTMTQSEKQQYAIFELQDRLQATIATYPEVTRAVVNIAMPEKQTFVLQDDVTEPTASVMVQTRPGRQLTPEQVQGVLNIVKNSVPGLTEQNISISDQSGDLLGAIAGSKTTMATKLELTNQVNETVKRRILTMLGPLYGEGKVNVAVNTVLDTNQKVTETTDYRPLDPENPRNNPLDYAEYAREKTGAGGFAQGVPGANDNTDTPEYLTPDQEANAADYYSEHNVLDYLVSSTKEQIIKEGLEITDLTVAVLIDTGPQGGDLDGALKRQIVQTVAKTAGIEELDSAGADNLDRKISVQGLAFNALDNIPGAATDNRLRNLAISAIIVVLALLIVFTIIIIMMRRRQARELAEEYAAEGATLVDLMGQDDDFEPIEIPETNEQRLKAQIRDLANSDPEIVAQLIKTWLIG